jgi:hypothetical protein
MTYGGKSGGSMPMGIIRKLTDKMKSDLKKHSVKHSKKHIASMRMNMMRGMSFDDAHKKAIKKGFK